MKSFIQSDFEIPQSLETKEFKLTSLTVGDLVKDYEAVMESADHLKGFFGPNSKWPPKDLTKEQDLKDLKWHQEEFEKRLSFTYKVETFDGEKYLGCVYIFPSRDKNFEADVFCWVRKSEFDKGLDPILLETVKNWISTKWPFNKVRYPGR